MNPLSSLTYYRRHIRHTVLLIALISLSTVGLYLMVGVLDSIPLRAQANDLTRVSRVLPVGSDALVPGIISQIQVHPDVERVIPDNGLHIAYPVLIGVETLHLSGVSVDDATYLMTVANLRIKDGRLFTPRTNEIVLTDAVARALDLQVGDEIDRSISEEFYYRVAAPLTVVGILEGDPAAIAEEGLTPRFGFVSGDYLDSHELYAPRQHGLIVVPKEGRLSALNEFLETAVSSSNTDVVTINELMHFVSMARQSLYVIFGLMNTLVAVVVALVMAAINRIALMQRLEELGVLHALGFDRRTLTRRMIRETAVITTFGWLAGLAISLIVLLFLRDTVLYAQGADLNLWNPAPFYFVIPIPLAIILSAVISTRRVFARLDAVQILEQGKLSTESEKPRKAAGRSATNPLSSLTFYLRHRRRGVLLVGTMALMILGVAFPAFLMLTSVNVMKPETETLRHISQVYPVQGQAVDAGVAAQIRSHPDVEQVVPTILLSMQMSVPPGGATGASIFGVSEQNMPLIMERLGVYLLEGQLPQPRSNEIIISQSIAQNRGLTVGDVVGGPPGDEPNPLTDDNIPAEMIISGILGPDVPWVGLASHEFLNSHELTQNRSENLLVIPLPGREMQTGAWLAQNVATTNTGVNTYEAEVREYEEMVTSISVAFALIESLIAIVAAVALATLNYIFFSQRQDEFGILHAIGRSRLWLVLRTLRETGSTVFLAWLIGAAVCVLGLLLAQAKIYAPLGLQAEIGNVLPWLFTLPIPLAVVLVSVGTIGRVLSKLDPVAIVERR